MSRGNELKMTDMDAILLAPTPSDVEEGKTTGVEQAVIDLNLRLQ